MTERQADLEAAWTYYAQHREEIDSAVQKDKEAFRVMTPDRTDDPASVVRGVRKLPPRTWPAEDFSDWQPPL